MQVLEKKSKTSSKFTNSVDNELQSYRYSTCNCKQQSGRILYVTLYKKDGPSIMFYSVISVYLLQELHLTYRLYPGSIVDQRKEVVSIEPMF